MKDKTLKQVRIILVIGIILICIVPFLLTRSWNLIDFTTTGQIGDTIGGLTAPIANLLGSILVFYALKAQIDANKIIQIQIENQKNDEETKRLQQYYLDQFKIIREDINDFTVIDSKTDYSVRAERETTHHITRKGADAIHNVVSALKHLDTDEHADAFEVSPRLSEIKNILVSIESLLHRILNSTLPESDKEYFRNMIAYLFKSKIKATFKANEKHKLSLKPPCKKCGKQHSGIPDELFDIVDSITRCLD